MNKHAYSEYGEIEPRITFGAYVIVEVIGRAVVVGTLADAVDQLEPSHAARAEQQTSIGAIDIQAGFVIERKASSTPIAHVILHGVIGAIVGEAKLAVDELEPRLAGEASPGLAVEGRTVFGQAGEVLLQEVAGLADGAFVRGGVVAAVQDGAYAVVEEVGRSAGDATGGVVGRAALDDEDAELARIDVDGRIVASEAVAVGIEAQAVGIDGDAHTIAECVYAAGSVEALLADEVGVEGVAVAGLADADGWHQLEPRSARQASHGAPLVSGAVVGVADGVLEVVAEQAELASRLVDQ